jgi:hypothetical protein
MYYLANITNQKTTLISFLTCLSSLYKNNSNTTTTDLEMLPCSSYLHYEKHPYCGICGSSVQKPLGNSVFGGNFLFQHWWQRWCLCRDRSISMGYILNISVLHQPCLRCWFLKWRTTKTRSFIFRVRPKFFSMALHARKIARQGDT